METINDRFRSLRECLGLSQEEFAKRANRTRSEIKNIEYGKTVPKDEVIKSVCIAHHVNEVWLRTGAGEMFRDKTRDEELAEIFARAQIEDGPRDRLLRTVAGLPPELCEVFLQFVIQTARQMKEEGNNA